MKIAITGSSGLVGSKLVEHFGKKGWEVVRIVRSGINNDQIVWDIERSAMDVGRLEGVDVIIHLAGANIADKRWTDAYKKKIYNSRIKSTELLAAKLAHLKTPPKVVFVASAIGIYGYEDQSKTYDEDSAHGSDFLATVCRDWEKATQPMTDKGIRVVNMRFGMIVSKQGGALKKMYVPFMLGAGGILGSGKQMMSWIALEEIPAVIDFLIDADVSGPVNFTSPEAITNQQFTKIFGKVIKRPTIFPVPAFGAQALFGEMADALLLNGVEVIPKKLTQAGYKFRYNTIEEALKNALGK